MKKARVKVILITGGAGFMGSNFIRYLLERYPRYKIVNLDKLTYAGNLDNLKDVKENSRYHFVKGDIGDMALVEKIFQTHKPTHLVNFAAESHVDRSILGPRQFAETDVLGLSNLLEISRKRGIERFVQISTDEVYGEVIKGEADEEYPFHPRSPYSASKAGGDHLALSYYHTYNLPVIRVHSCNFYGPYQHPEKFIPLFITNLLEGKTVPLYGDGRNVREWIYTEDACLAMDMVLHKGTIGEAYNIGTGYRNRNKEVAEMIAKLVGAPNTKIVHVKDRSGHDLRYAVLAAKIRKLGFAPSYTFTEGLKQTVAWYKENAWWWRKIKKKRDFREYYQKQYQK